MCSKIWKITININVPKILCNNCKWLQIVSDIALLKCMCVYVCVCKSVCMCVYLCVCMSVYNFRKEGDQDKYLLLMVILNYLFSRTF